MIRRAFHWWLSRVQPDPVTGNILVFLASLLAAIPFLAVVVALVVWVLQFLFGVLEFTLPDPRELGRSIAP